MGTTMLTQERVKELFDYKDGFLYYKAPPHFRIKHLMNRPDLVAGWINKNGRYLMSVNGKVYNMHKVIYLWHTGTWGNLIDHEDRNPLNCKIENLRDITPTQNCCNASAYRNCASKYKGVSKTSGRSALYYNWRVRIQVNYKSVSLGLFKDEVQAALAYNKGAVKYHGEFAVLNIIDPKQLANPNI